MSRVMPVSSAIRRACLLSQQFGRRKNQKFGNDKADFLISCQNVGFRVLLAAKDSNPKFLIYLSSRTDLETYTAVLDRRRP
jgi:hypothetical protein